MSKSWIQVVFPRGGIDPTYFAWRSLDVWDTTSTNLGVYWRGTLDPRYFINDSAFDNMELRFYYSSFKKFYSSLSSQVKFVSRSTFVPYCSWNIFNGKKWIHFCVGSFNKGSRISLGFGPLKGSTGDPSMRFPSFFTWFHSF